MCAARICVKDCSFRSKEGILLNLFVFCFRYDSVCPLVYTIMMLANSRCAAKRSFLKLKDGKHPLVPFCTFSALSTFLLTYI